MKLTDQSPEVISAEACAQFRADLLLLLKLRFKILVLQAQNRILRLQRFYFRIREGKFGFDYRRNAKAHQQFCEPVHTAESSKRPN